MPLQLQSDNKKQMKTEFTMPEASPSFNTIRDDSVLFKSCDHTEPFEEDNFSKLCDDVIMHIFNFLPKTVLVKCSAVCKRWRTLSYDKSLWKTYDFGGDLKIIKPGVLETLLKRGVSDLRLFRTEIQLPIFTNLELPNNQRFSCLQCLDLGRAMFASESLAHLFSVCNLKKLNLESCWLTDDYCRFIAQNKDLTVLNMARCGGYTSNGLSVIAKNCSKLIEWNLARRISYTCYFKGCCLEAFLPFLPSTITRFNISGHNTLDDKCLLTIMNRCPDLIELDIRFTPLLTEVSVAELIGKCIKLELLHTCGFKEFYCLRNQPHLEEFGLFQNFSNLHIDSSVVPSTIALRDWYTKSRHLDSYEDLWTPEFEFEEF